MQTTKRTPVRKYFHLGFWLLLSLTLASCGFHLKQTAAIPAGFGPVSVSGISEHSSLYKSIRNTLRQSDISITGTDSANHTIAVSNVRHERRVLSVDSAGKVAEYELIKSLTYRVLDRSGSEITEPQSISTNSSYSVSSNNDAIGESLEERESGVTNDVCARQINAVIERSGVEALTAGVIAYEPIWAIGTGKTATPEMAQETHAAIRNLIADKNADVAAKVRIQYGGSMNAGNAADLLAMEDIDGGLIGGASLKAEDFLAICKAAG